MNTQENTPKNVPFLVTLRHLPTSSVKKITAYGTCPQEAIDGVYDGIKHAGGDPLHYVPLSIKAL